MRAVIQRVKSASVVTEFHEPRTIGPGLAILLGVRTGDTEREAAWLADKTANLRIFEDAQGKMNLSLLDIRGEALVVSQFTLYADTRRGRRPSFTDAADPDIADTLYQVYASRLAASGLSVQTGWFGAKMLLSIQNDGPVTLILDTAESMPSG